MTGSTGSRPAWTTKTGGLDALGPTDRSAAMAAYQRWKSGAGAGLPYGQHSYVDYVQQAANAEDRGVPVENVEPY